MGSVYRLSGCNSAYPVQMREPGWSLLSRLRGKQLAKRQGFFQHGMIGLTLIPPGAFFAHLPVLVCHEQNGLADNDPIPALLCAE
jgi:hypothetical protein